MEKKLRYILFAGLFLIGLSTSISQTYSPSTNQSYSTCSGVFYDSGGSGGSYASSQDYTVTFCSNNGQNIYLNFGSFSTESTYDYLYVYDGPNTGSPLINTYTGSTGPGLLGGTNTCITVRFTSDGSVTYDGWAASIGCGTPPPPPCSTPAPASIPPGCSGALPFCTGSTYTFSNTTGTGDQGALACLSSTPNPTWYYLEIATAGNLDIFIEQENLVGAGIDVDFALMGPYTSVSAACASPSTGCVVDCSFSIAATETANITGAQVGEIYLLLLTNYEDVAGTITFSQTGGTGATDCSIVAPICNIDNFTANFTACDPGTNTYDVSGTIQFTDEPTSGSLIVEDCFGTQHVVDTYPFPGSNTVNYNITGLPADGAACDLVAYFSADPTCVSGTINYTAPECTCFFTYISVDNITSCNPADNTFGYSGTVEFDSPPSTGTLTISDCKGNTQVFNAPFSSPTAYSFTGLDSDGTTNCDITATFSADPACTITLSSIDFPSGCVCEAEAGTYVDGTVGNTVSTGPHFLCFNDELDITANGDYTPPQDFSPINDGSGNPITYDPGIWLLVYDCPPTLGPPDAIGGDPCLLGVASSADGAWTIANTSGSGTTRYYVPITMYSMVDGYYAISINGGNWCYDMGPVYPVTRLPQITTNTVTDCQAGTASITINGGMPSNDGSNFTASNLLPGTASFANTTTGNGGTIGITGLVDGDNFSFDIVDAMGCPQTVSGTFTGTEDPSFTYPQTEYCKNGANPSPTITGVPGGTFSSTAGLVINASTGVINLTTSTAGTYTITYTTPGAPCQDQATFVLTINPLPIVVVPGDVMCVGDPAVTLTASGADTYVWAPATGLSATTGTSVDANPASTQVYTITGTISATGCSSNTTTTVTVNPLPTINAGSDVAICIGGSTPLTASGGTSYSWSPATDLSATTGSTVTSSATATITYTVTGTDANGCINTDDVQVTVNPLPTVIVNDIGVCATGTVNVTASGANTYSWSPGTYLSATSGTTVTFTPGVTTTYTVTGTDANGCTDTDDVTVSVLPNAAIVASPDVTICNGELTNISASGGVSYNWDQGLGAGDNFNVTPASTTTYTVTGTDASGCVGSDQVIVTVLPLPIATIGGAIEVCQNAAQPTVTFTGSLGTAPYTFTYDINGGAPQTVVSDGAGVATVSAPTDVLGSFTYNLTNVEDASSQSCQQAVVDATTIIVNPTPTATINGDATLCVGDPTTDITFTGANGTAPYTFTYTINGGANQTINSDGTGVATITVSTVSAGTFAYDLVSVADASASACSQLQSGTATVVINPLPTASLVGNATVCVGDASPVVTFTGSNGTEPYTFTYTLNGGAATTIVSTGPTATISVPTGSAGSFVYALTGVEDASATTCAQAVSQNVTVTVNPLPTATVATDAEVCVDDAAPVVTFTGANGTSPYTFTYTINGGANQTVTSVGNTATVNQTTATSGSFVYDLVSVSDASATGCAQAQVGTTTITINPLPTATVTGTVAVCVDDAEPIVTFTAGPSGVAPYTFTYNINGGANQTVVSTGSTATLNVPTSAAGTFNYNLVSVEDASSTSCAQNQAGTATVTVNPNPVPVIQGATEYCTGTTATLSTTMAYASYLWSNGATSASANFTAADNPITVDVTNGFGCSATSPAFIVTENSVITYNTTEYICQGESIVIHGNTETSAGVYSQTFVLPTGCDSTSNVTLVVNPLPVIDAGVDQALCDTDPVTLTATGAPTIAWSPVVSNGVPFTQAVGTVLYTATGTDANGCVNTDDVQVIVNPLPDATIGSNATVCVGDAAPSITFTGSNGTAPYTFAYTLNGVAQTPITSVGNTATLSASTATDGTFVYALTGVTDASSTTCSKSVTGSATVIVNRLPSAIITGTNDVCVGGASQTITFTGSNGVTPYTFTYSLNAGAPQTIISSGNTATITVPTTTAGTFSYDLISVTDASSTACSQAQTGNATVIVNPLPMATISGTTTVCTNDPQPQVTFTGTNGTAPYTFTYNINNGPNQTITSDLTGIVTVNASTTNAGTFNYNLVSVQDASSTSCSRNQPMTITVKVNPLPTATISSGTNVCLNGPFQSVTFTGANGTVPYTFTYSINGGAPQMVSTTGISSAAVISVPSNVAGTFTYSLLNVQDGSVTSCSQAVAGQSASFTVHALPAIVANAVDPDVCIGTSVTLFGSGGIATPVSYAWTPFVNNNVAFTPAVGSTTYTVTGTDANGCKNTDNITVTVHSLPTVIATNDVAICNGESTALGVTMSDPSSYSWTPASGLSSTTAPQVIANPTATTMYTVTGTDIYGCQNSDNVIVTVNPIPNINAGADFLICENQTAVLTGSGAGAGGTYVWTGGVVNGQTFTPSVGINNYTVTGTTVNNCSSQDQVSITVEGLPAVSFTADNTSGCSPVPVTLTNTTPGNLNSCVWTLSNGQVLFGCDEVSTVFTAAGCYDVTLTTTSSNGCTNSSSALSYICVDGLPTAAFVPNPNVVTTLNPEVTFINGSQNATIYAWDFGDGSGSSASNPVHMYSNEEPGVYVIQLIAETPAGCLDTAYATVRVEEELIFYVPNTFTPDSDAFNDMFSPVFTSGFDPFDYTLFIFNRWGEIIFESHNAEIGWDGTYGVDGELSQDGTYTWKIEFKTTNTDERKMYVGHVNLIR